MRRRKLWNSLFSSSLAPSIHSARKRSVLGDSHRRRRLPSEVLEARHLLAGDLIAHWRADEIGLDDGATIAQWDDTVADLPAVGVGSPTLVANAINGRAAVRFNPSDNVDGFRLRAPQNPFAAATDFSVAVVFVTSSTNLVGGNAEWFKNTGLVDSSAQGFSTDWGVSINAAGQIAAGLGGGFGEPPQTLYSSTGGLNDGQVHLAVVTRTGSTVSIHVDDQPVDVQTNFNAAPRNQLDITWGMLQDNSGAFEGQIAEVRLYDGALNDAEVATLRADIDGFYNNSAPVAQDDQYSLNEDPGLYFVAAAQGLLANDSDADGDPLTVVLVTPPQHGELVLNANGSFVYSPSSDYFGTDSFTYAASDFRPGNVATVSLEIRPVYDPPVPLADQYKTTPTGTLQVSAVDGLFVNDRNVDGAAMTAVLEQDVANGTLALQPDGSFTYAPNGFAGTTTFSYRLNDGQGLSAPATVTLIVNTAPAPVDDAYTIDEDQVLDVVAANGVLANDLDADGNTLTPTLVAQPTHGTLTLSPDGSFQYTPAENFFGDDQFTYSVSDGVDTSGAVTVRLTVQAVNDPPVVVADAYVVTGSRLDVDAARGLLANDLDIDSQQLTAELVNGPQQGSLQLQADGSFTYQQAAGFTGQDRFTYRVIDGQIITEPVEVIVVVQPSVAGTSDPTGDSVVTFNEVMYNPNTALSRAEWIELHNQMGINMDISGWQLTGGVYFRFPEGTIIPGNGFLVIASNPVVMEMDTGFAGALGPFSGSLSNGGEELILRNNSDRLMDIFEYADSAPWPVGPAGSGASLAKRSGHLASEPASNWQASFQMNGTPGAVNFTATDLAAAALPQLNEIAAGDGEAFAVELFNPTDQAIDLAGYRLGSATIEAGMLPAGGYATFDETLLGTGFSDGDSLFLITPDGLRLADAQRVSDRLTGRDAALGGRWFYPSEATFGAENVFQVDQNIVINEIMYHAPGIYVPQLDRLFAASEQWIELYNRSNSETVDLGGWWFGEGIDYVIPQGVTLAPNSYLVIANDPGALLRSRPELNASQVIGTFTSNLSNAGENLQLLDPNGNLVDEVHYYDSGRWPGEADGHGASLELRDPFSDNTVAEAWAASDEWQQVAWQTLTFRGLGRNIPGNPQQYHEFLLGLLDDGTVLIDDITVIEHPGTPEARQMIQNGSFEGDALGNSPATWRIIGNQHGSVVADPDNPDNHVLMLTSKGSTEHMHNNAGTTLKVGDEYPRLSNTAEYEISFRARWISGSNQLNSRLYFNRLGRTTRLDRPLHVGTPGRVNSQRVENIGPTLNGLRHWPAVPDAGQPVEVTIEAADPQGVNGVQVWYSVAGGDWTSAPMTLSAGRQYVGTIPGQAEGTLVQFYVAADDTAGADSMYPASGPESRVLYRVQDGQAAADQRHTLRILMTPEDADRLHTRTNVMSNDRIGATVIYRESEVFYDVGVRLKGSQRGRFQDVRVGFNVGFDPDNLFRGVHGTIGVDRSGSGDEYSQEEIIVRQVFNHAGQTPQIYDDLIHVIAPLSKHSGSAMLNTARYNDVFLDSQYENGSEGTAFEYELIYYPTTTEGGVEGLKLPTPDSVTGVNMADQGDDKEAYRWHWLIENNRREDDYSRLMEVLKTLGGRSSEPGYHERLAEAVDVDHWLRAFALTILTGIGDNYSSGAQHNGIFYVRPSDNRLLYLPWDMDFSFTQGATSPLLSNNEQRKMMEVPANERAYYGHVLDILDTTFNAEYMNPWIDHFDELVPSQNFFQGFKNYINTRSNFARGRVEVAVPIVPFEITTAGPMDVGQGTTAQVAGTGWVDVRQIRLAGSEIPLSVRWITNNQWEIDVPVSMGTHDVVLEAYDFQGALVSSATINVTSSGSSPIRDFLRVTEVNYNPADRSGNEALLDHDEFEFLELINVGDQPIDLAGVQLIQVMREGELEGIRFTFGAQLLQPNERLVVARNRDAFVSRYGAGPRLADGQGDASGFGIFSGHLDNGGETLTLIDAYGAVIQQFAFDDGWYGETDGDGYTLEFVDPTMSDLSAWDHPRNWSPSSTLGGTPGRGSETFGDANLDGVFDTADLILVLQAGEYEDGIADNSTWAEGDWSGDGEFDTHDLVLAFASSTYVETGPPLAASPPHLARVGAAVDTIFAEQKRKVGV